MVNLPGFFLAASCTWILSSSARHGGSVRIRREPWWHLFKLLSPNFISINALHNYTIVFARIDLFKKSCVSFSSSLIDRHELGWKNIWMEPENDMEMSWSSRMETKRKNKLCIDPKGNKPSPVFFVFTAFILFLLNINSQSTINTWLKSQCAIISPHEVWRPVPNHYHKTIITKWFINTTSW